MENPFLKFNVKTKQAFIKALGTKVTLKQPTIADNEEFRKGVFVGGGEDGKPSLNYDNLYKSNIKKVALCMTDPKMTVEELEKLSTSADEALAEIVAEIDNWENNTGN